MAMSSCEVPHGHSQQVIITGMSRSGTSLTASIVASLLSNASSSWRGSGLGLRSDVHNPLGYFERLDLVLLNHGLARAMSGQITGGWTIFPENFTSDPSKWVQSSINSTSAWRESSGFNTKARQIIDDMNQHQPWVLKDVRFARTLPAWKPLLSNPVCIIPFRHPAEVVESSSVRTVDRWTLWRNYMVSAVTVAQDLQCPTLFVSFGAWMSDGSAALQLARLHRFLRCAGVVSSPSFPSRILSTIRKGATCLEIAIYLRHYHAHKDTIPDHLQCIWEWLQSSASKEVSFQPPRWDPVSELNLRTTAPHETQTYWASRCAGVCRSTANGVVRLCIGYRWLTCSCGKEHSVTIN